MLFNSIDYLFFLPIVVTLYYLLPHRLRWILLLMASYIFYMAWKKEYILLIVLSTAIDYFCSKQMSKKKDKTSRKPYLYLSLLSNLGILFTFKYFDFFISSVNTVSSADIPLVNLLLPMGISFYTFQTMSYSIDVYQGKLKAESHLGIFALFVTFFPQLVAGPIERASALLPQFHIVQRFDFANIKQGLKHILWGVFKKVVIADRLSILVNTIYNNPEQYDASGLTIATIFFSFQIYCDFSGYSDIAIGSAKLLGFDLMKNFERPYLANSIADFWRRWHISLSTWFKDYVYIPLGGNRTVKWRWYYNLFITFLISGIWHGANWTFVIWGAYHGALLIIGQILLEKTSVSKLPLFIRQISVFILVNIGWIFFRSNSFNDSKIIFSKILHPQFGNLKDILWTTKSALLHQNQVSLGSSLRFDNGGLDLGITLITLLFSLSLIVGLILFERLKLEVFRNTIQSIVLRWGLYIILILMILLAGVFEQNEFIYFQF